MPEASDLTADAIKVAAQEPASASVDGQSAAAVSIGDQIKALQFAQEQAAAAAANGSGGARSAWSCTRTARVRPPGGT